MKLMKKLVLGCAVIALSHNIYGAASPSEQPFDQNALVRQLLTKQITPAQYVDLLAAQTDNDEAQEKLYNVLNKGFLTVSKDEDQARGVLSRAVKAEKTWALWIHSNKIRRGEKPTKYDVMLFNRGSKEVKKLFSGVFAEINREIARLKKITPEKIKRELTSFNKSYGIYAYAYYELSKLLKEKEMIDESNECLINACNLGGYYEFAKLTQDQNNHALDKKHYDLACQSIDGGDPDIKMALSYYRKIKNPEIGDDCWLKLMIFQRKQMDSMFDIVDALMLENKYEDVISVGSKLLQMNIKNYKIITNERTLSGEFKTYMHNNHGIIINGISIYIGSAYENGFKNYEKALEYYSYCNDYWNNYYVGSLFLKKIPERYEEGMRCLTKAAHEGLAVAMMELVHVYLSSFADGDREKGMFWLEHANAFGYEPAKQYLENLEMEESKIQEIIDICDNTRMPDLPSGHEEMSVEDPEDVIEVSESSSSSSEPVIEIVELGEVLPAYTSIRNPKYIRDNLRRIKAERTAEYVQPMLSGKSQMIAQRILEEDNNVSYNDLCVLFSDPAFARHQVSLSLTKNGLMVKAKNMLSNVYETTSTHKAHRGSKTEAFRVQLRELLTKVFPFVIT